MEKEELSSCRKIFCFSENSGNFSLVLALESSAPNPNINNFMNLCIERFANSKTQTGGSRLEITFKCATFASFTRQRESLFFSTSEQTIPAAREVFLARQQRKFHSPITSSSFFAPLVQRGHSTYSFSTYCTDEKSVDKNLPMQ